MKKLIFSIMILASSLKVDAQCAYDNALYLSGAAPSAVGNSVTAQQTWGGEYNRITGMQAGFTYEITSCNTPSFDSEITVYPAGGGNSVAYDDDGCGTVGGASKIMFTPAVTGDYDILLDEFGCLSNSIDMDVTITLVSTGGPAPSNLTIPVVVHVVHKNNSENVSDAQIQSQIDALNRDYRKLNADFAQVPQAFQSFGADMNINFCLASVDPNGNPTTGITRTSTSVPVFSHSNEPKSTATGGHDNWNPNKYLNMWVCDLDGGLLGYATFPADLAAEPQLDGVVIDYQFFGTINATAPFDNGRTATHEVGHWLNLRHIWGDSNCGDDFVGDTPTQQQANLGCPNFPVLSCNSGTNGDMFMNYMDYTDDDCMMMFTTGQKQRVDITLANIRNGLASSSGCGVTGMEELTGENSVTLYPNPASGTVTISSPDFANAAITLYNYLGAAVRKFEAEASEKSIIADVSDLEPGLYIVELSNSKGRSLSRLIIK